MRPFELNMYILYLKFIVDTVSIFFPCCFYPDYFHNGAIRSEKNASFYMCTMRLIVLLTPLFSFTLFFLSLT